MTVDVTNALVNAGAAFNDATNLLEGGLTPTTVGQYTTDMQNAQASITNILDDYNATSVSVGPPGTLLTASDVSVLSQVQSYLGSLLAEPPSPPGDAALHTAVLNQINGDATLAAALAANPLPGAFGSVGFQAMPVGNDSAAEISAISQSMTPALADIGQVFNAVEMSLRPSTLSSIGRSFGVMVVRQMSSRL
jgi:hypothetical protein